SGLQPRRPEDGDPIPIALRRSEPGEVVDDVPEAENRLREKLPHSCLVRQADRGGRFGWLVGHIGSSLYGEFLSSTRDALYLAETRCLIVVCRFGPGKWSPCESGSAARSSQLSCVRICLNEPFHPNSARGINGSLCVGVDEARPAVGAPRPHAGSDSTRQPSA